MLIEKKTNRLDMNFGRCRVIPVFCFKSLYHFREGTGRLLVLLVSKSLFNQAGIVISFETGT